ncbi:extensin-like [Patiria miniata]|uniref:Uncharacterized protein n=1 Tax=Patiria miniata TaxID=46514 RepID=A0A914AHH8_PATMI|nr:extensin-like [Patiria miniata]
MRIMQLPTHSEDDLRRHQRRMHDQRPSDNRRVRPYTAGRENPRYAASRREPEDKRVRGRGSEETRAEVSRPSPEVKITATPSMTAPSTPPQQMVNERFLQIHPSPSAMSVELNKFEPGPTLTTAELMDLMESLKTPSPPSRRSSPTRGVPSPLPPDQPIEVSATPASPVSKWVDAIEERITELLPPPPSAEKKPREDGDATTIAAPLAPAAEHAEEIVPRPPITPATSLTTEAAEITARPPTAAPEVPPSLPPPPHDPRFVRSRRPSSAPKTTAGAEVEWMRLQARADPNAVRRREDTLHPIDFGLTVRLVTETATFPDGREFSTSFTEYTLPSQPKTPRAWTRDHEL